MAKRSASTSGLSPFKRQTFYALENPRRAKSVARVIGIALFCLILLNATLVFVSAQPGLDPLAANVINGFYRFSTACFAIEYICRIWIANVVFPDVSPPRARLRYICSPLGIIDLLSFLPNVIAWFFYIPVDLRSTINLLRLVRLLKISRYMRGLRTIGRVLKRRRHEITASVLVIVLLIVVSSVIMYQIENPAQPDKFNSLFSGIYWAVTTVTGTGYGDLVPITVPGRLVGSMIMFLSVILVAIPGGIFSAGFIAEFQNAKLRRIERNVKHDAEEESQQAEEESRDANKDSKGDGGGDGRVEGDGNRDGDGDDSKDTIANSDGSS